MFKKLRWHIILIELGAFLFITVLIVAAINIGFTAQINRRTVFDEIIEEAKLRQNTSGRNPFELA